MTVGEVQFVQYENVRKAGKLVEAEFLDVIHGFCK